MPTRRAITSFSLQVLTNSRYFCRLSKKRKLRVRVAAGAAAAARRRRARASRAADGMSSRRASPGPRRRGSIRKALTRSSVSGVMRAPSRRRATNLPSLTARRPKVDSAMPARRQNSEMLSNRPIPASAMGCASSALPRQGWSLRFARRLGANIVGRQPQMVHDILWDTSHSDPRALRRAQRRAAQVPARTSTPPTRASIKAGELGPGSRYARAGLRGS